MTETRATCVLAMSRLTDATVEMIRTTAPDKLPFMAAPMGPDMITAYCHTENGGEPPIPDDLWACIQWARAQELPPTKPITEGFEFPGYDYILFDSDKDPLEDGCELPIAGYELPTPPAPWGRRDEPIWMQVYGANDHGGQRCALVLDGHDQPIAYVLADEDDREAEGALAMITSAPDTAKRYAALVKIFREMIRDVDAYDAKLNDPHGDGSGNDSKAPTGDDYNDALNIVADAANAAEAVISGL